jgi:transcriptional regulator with XRE-family HTH domain
MDFREWLSSKLDEKGLSIRQVAHRSKGKISNTSINRILAGKQVPTCDTCIGIADGLGEPRWLVLEIAGILEIPPPIKLTAAEVEWLRVLHSLSAESQADLIKYAKMKKVMESRIEYRIKKGEP